MHTALYADRFAEAQFCHGQYTTSSAVFGLVTAT